MTTDADAVQDLFDHGVMALTKKKHPVWVIKVSYSHIDRMAEAGYNCLGTQQICTLQVSDKPWQTS